MKGLVLEGGAMRGLFTAGVLDVMMENGIAYDGIIGVSAGAAFGCNYKSNQPGRAIRYNTAYCRDPRYCSFRSLIRTGDIFGADFCYHEMPEKLDIFDRETFRLSPTAFYVVCTDVKTGKPVYRQLKEGDYNDLEWMRASASLPLVSRIVEVDGYSLLDGGVADSIPLRRFEEMGYDKNVVVLTQPEGYVKKKNGQMPLIRLALRKYPAFVDAVARRHESYNKTLEYIAKREQAGDVFVIRPPKALPIGHMEHDPEMLRQIHRIGRKAMTIQLSALKRFLNQK